MYFGVLNPLFRLADFFVRICRANALLALIFPVPVFLNRFAAPRFVFNFGTFLSSYLGYGLIFYDGFWTLERSQDHDKISSFKLGSLLDLSPFLRLLCNPAQHVPSQVRMGNLPPSKNNRSPWSYFPPLKIAQYDEA